MCDRDCFNCHYDDCICEEVTAEDLAGLKKAEIVAGLRAEEPDEYEEIRRKKNEYQKAYYHRHKEQYKKYKAEYYRKNKELSLIHI